MTTSLYIEELTTSFETLIQNIAPLPESALLETFPENTGHSILAFDPIPPLQTHDAPPNESSLPFIAGPIGYTTYEGEKHYNYYNKSIQKTPGGSVYLVHYNPPELDEEDLYINNIISKTPPQLSSFATTEPRSNTKQKQYEKMVRSLQEKIKEGDVYQANLSYRYHCDYKGHPVHLYQALKTESPTPYATFLNFKNSQIISASPELFLKITPDGTLTTKPIKGTIHQTGNPKEDQQLQDQLIHSEKDNAELLMITDLLRNDLGKIAQTGSVKVPKLTELENYAHLSHLVSTITAKLLDTITPEKAIMALFPGGSITGAPKHTALKAISQLEKTPRGPYTGAIGYHSICGNSQFSIAIRSAYTDPKNQTLYFHTGAGITSASDPESEYQETLTKAKAFLNILK